MSEQGEQSELIVEQIQIGPMANFTYLVGSRSTREVAVVDPAWDIDALLERIDAQGYTLSAALVTHYHQDHVGGEIFGHSIEGLSRLLERKPMPVHVNQHEAEGLLQVTGISDSDLVRHASGDTVELGGVTVRLVHTPGHTPGSQCFLVEERDQAGRLVSGDTLFLNGCGRVDLPGSDPRAMFESLETLKRMPDETVLYPGHLYSPEGHDALGEQKRTNPYLRAASVETFLSFMGY